MATGFISENTNRQIPKILGPFRMSIVLACFAAIAGTAVGFLSAVAIALPAMHQEMMAQAKTLSARYAAGFESAPLETQCEQFGQVGVGGSGGGAGAAPISGMAPSQSAPGISSSPSNNAININNNKSLINKIITVRSEQNKAIINNTAPKSVNVINTKNEAKTTITNVNKVNVTSVNKQQATSGNAAVVDNTIGGGAASGNAQNANRTGDGIEINN